MSPKTFAKTALVAVLTVAVLNRIPQTKKLLNG